VTQLLTKHNTQRGQNTNIKHTVAHKVKASKKKRHVSETGSASVIRWKRLKATYSVINVQGRIRTVGNIGELSNNNCKKHKTTQALAVKIRREFSASNEVEN
jgi:hypothetical protein